MSNGVSRDIGEIEKGLQELTARAGELIDNSSYTAGTNNDTTFQSINGQASVSVGKAVTEVSAIDTVAYKSVQSWKNATENLIAFINNDKQRIETADNAQG